MFSLTRQEQTLIVCLLLSVALGSIVQHYRRLERNSPTTIMATPTPSLRARDLYDAP